MQYDKLDVTQIYCRIQEFYFLAYTKHSPRMYCKYIYIYIKDDVLIDDFQDAPLSLHLDFHYFLWLLME